MAALINSFAKIKFTDSTGSIPKMNISILMQYDVFI